MDAEKWLEENVLADDWSKLEEGLNDALWTNNVLEYMEQYAVYKAAQKASSNSEYKQCENCGNPTKVFICESCYEEACSHNHE